MEVKISCIKVSFAIAKELILKSGLKLSENGFSGKRGKDNRIQKAISETKKLWYNILEDLHNKLGGANP